MAKTESSKSNFKIILISVLIIGLLAVSVSAYVFKDKIFTQKSEAILDQNNQTQKPNSTNETAKTDPKPQNSLALPLFVIQGIGYDPKAMNAYEVDKDPNKVYPDSVDLVKIYDQNNKELISPKLGKNDKIVQDGDNYYIVRYQENKKVELWNPKNSVLKILEMPIEFDNGTFNVQNEKIYIADYNSGGQEDGLGAKCGEFNYELGKCSIYEVDPVTLKSTVLVGNVRSQMFGGVMDRFLSKDKDFIWLIGETGDGGTSFQSFRKFDAMTKALISTVKIENQFSDQTLYFTQTGKIEQEITKIKCFDENASDPSISTCTSKIYADFDAEVYKLIPKEFYKSQDPALEQTSKITCGKYEMVDGANQGQQVLYGGKSIIDLTQLYIQNSVCVK